MLRRWMTGIALALLHGAGAAASASEPPAEGRSDTIRLEWAAARSGRAVLLLAPRPGAEDPWFLAWLRRSAGAEAHVCFLSCGEAQAWDGPPPPDPASGRLLFPRDPAQTSWLRIQEAEAAAAFTGSKAWRLNLPDLVAPRSQEEVWKAWNREQALAGLVRLLRLLRPDAAACVEDPALHGAERTLLQEAVAAAADAKRFPEQTVAEGLRPWRVSASYHLARDSRAQPPAMELGLREAEVLENGARAFRAYSSLDREAFVAAPSTVVLSPLTVAEGENPFRAGALPEAWRFLNEDLPAAPAEQVAFLGRALGRARKSAEKETGERENAVARRRVRHLERAYAAALGCVVEIGGALRVLAAGEETELPVRCIAAGPRGPAVREARVVAEPGWEASVVREAGNAERARVKLKAGPAAFPSYPPAAFLGARMEERAAAALELEIAPEGEGEVAVRMRTPLPVALAPDYLARPVRGTVMVLDDPDQGANEPVLCRAALAVTNYGGAPRTLFVRLIGDGKFLAQRETPEALRFTARGETRLARFGVMIRSGELAEGDVAARFQLGEGEGWRSETVPLVYRRLPAKLPAPLNVGVVRGPDPGLWDALRELAAQIPGLAIIELGLEELRENELRTLHTVVVDQEALRWRPEAADEAARLRGYMEAGGHLLCMAQRPRDWQTETGRGRRLAPFALSLVEDRAVGTKAGLVLPGAAHTILSRPSKLWEKDFAGWSPRVARWPVRERDRAYLPLATASEGEGKAPDGLLLLAKCGNGSFGYASLELAEQLRAGHPGAHRILINLLSYPRVREREP